MPCREHDRRPVGHFEPPRVGMPAAGLKPCVLVPFLGSVPVGQPADVVVPFLFLTSPRSPHADKPRGTSRTLQLPGRIALTCKEPSLPTQSPVPCQMDFLPNRGLWPLRSLPGPI